MRIVVVGTGSAGSRHAAIARELLPDADITVVRTVEDLTPAPVDIGVVASPSTTHAREIDLLRAMGAHLLIEKPLAAQSAQARDTVGSAAASGAIELVGYNLRFTESLQTLRTELLSGTIGRPLTVRCSTGQWLPEWRPDADYRNGVTAQRSLGGGVLLELSHEFDYLTWLFGLPAWVMANVARVGDLEIDVEDAADVLLGYETSSGPSIGSVSLDMVRRNGGRECTVIGELGTLRWDAVAGTVDLFDGATREWKEISRTDGDVAASYTSEWRHFLDCVNGEAKPLITLQDALSTLDIVDACRVSSDEGRRVEVTTS